MQLTKMFKRVKIYFGILLTLQRDTIVMITFGSKFGINLKIFILGRKLIYNINYIEALHYGNIMVI